MGTLFGPWRLTAAMRAALKSNTLTDGHPLRTKSPYRNDKPLPVVSIPSLMGTLFGHKGGEKCLEDQKRSQYLTDGHPLRTNLLDL